MTLRSQRERKVTEGKLRRLEELYARTLAEPAGNAYAQTLTLRSLRQTTNQLKEEMAQFEARTGSAARDDNS